MRGPREDEPALWQTYPRAKVGVDFLLTWNIRHLANAAMRRRIEAACREAGFAAPVLCTPEELMEG